MIMTGSCHAKTIQGCGSHLYDERLGAASYYAVFGTSDAGSEWAAERNLDLTHLSRDCTFCFTLTNAYV